MLSRVQDGRHAGLLRAFAIGRPLRVFRLARREPYERILGWDVDPAGLRLAVMGPAATELHLVDAAKGRPLRSFTVPPLANTDPRFSLLKFLDGGRLVWITKGEDIGAFDLMVMDVADPTRPRRRPIGRMTVRALEVQDGRAFIVSQERGVLVVDLDDGAAPTPVPSETPVGFARGWDDGLHIVETRRDPAAVESGDLARIEATRRPLLRPIRQSAATSDAILLPSAPASSIVTALPDGWAILAGPPLMAPQGVGARIVVTDAHGGAVDEHAIAPGGAQPAAIVSDGDTLYAAFVQSDQPLRALERATGQIASTRIKAGALAFLLRPKALFFQNNDMVGAFVG